MDHFLVPIRQRSIFEQAASQLIAAKKSPHTRAAYTADVDRWIEFCHAMRGDPMRPSLVLATAFREHLTASGSIATTRRRLAAISFIYRELRKHQVVETNPFHPSVLPWPALSRIGKTPIVKDEVVRRMMESAASDDMYGLRDTALLRLLYDCGLRRASAISLTRQNLRQQEGNTYIRVVVKGGTEREVRLPARTAETLQRWIAAAPPSPYVFPGARGGPMNLASVNKIVRKRGKEAGDDDVHPHRFRASFITAAYDAGIPERDIQESVHHADARTTRLYDRHQRGTEVPDRVASLRDEKP